ncbi:MAG: nucleotidyltransferase substrate binding protein [Gammaproteobacteria bacterium]|nr:nucleotidyltransferase substrate binding protein [Gammaproteobacteria bacterium]
MSETPRWAQRYTSYSRALTRLNEAVALMAERPLTDLEKQGTIQSFEFTYELAWKLLKDYLEWQGTTGLAGPRDTLREAFKVGLVSDGHPWMAMLQDRKRSAHTYNEDTANAIVSAIRDRYARHLDELASTFAHRQSASD